ncbi:MAG TPA: carboxypeptidase-like regulatory domain-containing protein [Terriglobia bacterium]|nr:carboxypeptidase-like regulatory domain-containing protein [Terriglobia bacterium]
MKTKKKSGDAARVDPAEWRVSKRRRQTRTRRLCLGASFACALLALLTPSGLFAKKKTPPTKTVQGEVLDAASLPIVGAAVELTDDSTHKKLGIHSEAGGRYKFTGLTPTDDYEVKATYKGQNSEVRHASSLDGRSIVVLNLTIPAPATP